MESLMSADLVRKTCKMCCMEIPEGARKCPFCQHFQTRLSMIVLHPAFFALLACVPLIALLVVFARIFDQGEDFASYRGQIQIAESRMTFGETKSGGTVVVMGMITNTSPVPWKEIQFHADFFDPEGQRVDVGQREEYSFYLPAGATTSFKVSFRREFAETNYAKHSVQVLSAKDARVRW